MSNRIEKEPPGQRMKRINKVMDEPLTDSPGKFTLRSGNGPLAFKEMGSSPGKMAAAAAGAASGGGAAAAGGGAADPSRLTPQRTGDYTETQVP